MDSDWWPTKGTVSRQEYVGSESCAKCHSDKLEMQKETPMAHALSGPVSILSRDLSKGPLEFRVGKYDYRIANSKTGVNYSVSDGNQTDSVPLKWVFGIGQFGRTYVFERNGSLFESRVSYYSAPRTLDFTTGSPRFPPSRIENALGRRMSPNELPLCFGCHSTGSTTENHFDQTSLTPGVTCEACHGPGAQHVAEMNVSHEEPAASSILNPARLPPVDSVDFCGACHRTSVDVALSGVTGMLTLRFPAYRLQKSRCWQATKDVKLTCIACHDAHGHLVRDASYYDRQCLACHSRNNIKPSHSAANKTCPVGQRACSSCHMPKFNIPDMHTSFTDHKIAIHREGAQFSE